MTRSSSEEFQSDALARKVLNLDVTFHWMAGSDRFWFKRQSRQGDETVIVDAQTGAQTVRADESDRSAFAAPAGDCVISPDGRQGILRRDHDLWAREMITGRERRLTRDGELHFGYGDIDGAFDRRAVARRRAGQPAPLQGVIWSPDSRFVIALRQDLRSVAERLFIAEYVAPDGGYTHAQLRRMCIAGDEKAPDSWLVAIDTKTLSTTAIALDPQTLNDYALHYFLAGVVWWNVDGDRLFLIGANRGGSRYALRSVELGTGRAREILHETAHFNVRLNPVDIARPNVYVTCGGDEIIWYSERSGYGHLYLYDGVNGRLKRQLTQGEWVVFDLLQVDETHRLAYFTAAARDPDANPYYRYLYRVSLDGGEPQLLTPEIADHRFNNYFGPFRAATGGEDGMQPGSVLSPCGRYFVDSYSTVEQPPEYVLRSTSGELIAKVLSSDPSELYAAGWRPPERVVIRAADGITDLHGVITYPRDFDPVKCYPVLDCMYPGPQGSWAPRTFVDQLAGGAISHLHTFADAGFIVLAIDGRGTAHRSRTFREAFLATEDVFGAADHVAAIRQLAAQRPCMDLGRVGVRGQSFGGYGALRAMLLFPDFFKVGIAATGPGKWLDMQGQISVERFFGVPGDSAGVRAYYESLSNAHLAERLRGHVLLIYGGIDENVPLKHAFTVLDAFIKADKDIDMLFLPDSTHAAPKEPYALRRSIRYVVEHLGRPNP